MPASKASKRNVQSLPSISQSIEMSSDRKQPEERRKRKKKLEKQELQAKPSFEQDLELVQHIEFLHDDIVTISSITPQKCSADDPNMNQLANGVFLEIPGGFKEIRKSELFESTDVCEPYATHHKLRMKSDLSIIIQRFYHRVTSLAHGLLSGISLWEFFVVYFLHPPHFTHSDFSKHYSSLSTASQISFFVLLVICLLDILDRGDLIRVDSNFLRHFFIIGSSSIVLLLYFISFILTLHISTVEIKYSEYLTPNITNATEWQITIDDHNSWWNIVLARCVILCLSWIVLNLWPSESRLLLHLEEIKEQEMIKDNAQISMAL